MLKIKPTKIIAVGLNYHEHAKELGFEMPSGPLIFMKPVTAIIGHEESIIYPQGVSQLDYEAELAVIIKKEAKDVSKEEALDYVLGYTCANDVTARDLQKKDGQWTRAKGFDTFCPLGPRIVSGINPDNLAIKLYLNGELKQASKTSDMIFKVREIVSFVSKVMTLKEHDVILTGTPSGIGPMQVGDCVEVEIEKVGRLSNFVTQEKVNIH